MWRLISISPVDTISFISHAFEMTQCLHRPPDESLSTEGVKANFATPNKMHKKP